jgi:hypothetical protein
MMRASRRSASTAVTGRMVNLPKVAASMLKVAGGGRKFWSAIVPRRARASDKGVSSSARRWDPIFWGSRIFPAARLFPAEIGAKDFDHGWHEPKLHH